MFLKVGWRNLPFLVFSLTIVPASSEKCETIRISDQILHISTSFFFQFTHKDSQDWIIRIAIYSHTNKKWSSLEVKKKKVTEVEMKRRENYKYKWFL